MNRNTKILLGVLAAVVLLCVCAGISALVLLRQAGQAFEEFGEGMLLTDPVEIAAASAEMLDYELPPGYQEESLIDVVFGKMLMIVSRSEDGITVKSGPVIMIFQLSSLLGIDDTNSGELTAQMQDSLEQQVETNNITYQVVEVKETTIADQTVELVVMEGEDDQGVLYRQVISEGFQTKGGYTMVMLNGLADHWPQEDIDAFIDSIQ